MMDAESLKLWTKQIQAAFPGWQVVEIGDVHDAVGGGIISIIDTDEESVAGHLPLNDERREIIIYETPNECDLHGEITWNLDRAIEKELKRQERAKSRRALTSCKTVKAK